MAIARKLIQRLHRHARVRGKVSGTAERPRLSAHRTGKNFECQIVNDISAKTICSFTTLAKDFKAVSKKGGTIAAAKAFGSFVAKALKSKGITKIAFDRGGYLYHGRVKTFADALREGGVNF